MNKPHVLEVSFYGPLAFDFQEQGVKVFAPVCDGHLASVQTNYEERELAGRHADGDPAYQYKLEGDFGSASTRCCNVKEIIAVENTRRQATLPPLNECYWHLDVPRPAVIEGLVCDHLTRTEYGDHPNPKPKGGRCATAMRFYYHVDDNAEFRLVQFKNGAKSTVIDDKCVPAPWRTHFPINVRYASHVLDYTHKDAAESFARLRTLFPPLGAWKVDFDSRMASRHNHKPTDDQSITRVTIDCHAAQLVFATPKEMQKWQTQDPMGANSKVA